MRTPQFEIANNARELKNAINNQVLENESFDQDLHLNEFVKKPWGHEYRIFCNQMYDAWKLKILPRQETSMHCHPRKDTVLLCLEGTGTITHMGNNSISLVPGKYVHIPKGAYHSTSSGEFDLHLIELENPRNKLDLLRLTDRYGREKEAYEKDSDRVILEKLDSSEIGINTYLRSTDYEKSLTFHYFQIQIFKKS